MNRKSIVVLDINVLLFDPESIYGFPEKEIVLPVCIFETLDILKKDLGEKGRAAQVVSHLLDKCSKMGNLVEGVILSNRSKLRIDLSRLEEIKIPCDFDSKNYSNYVLALAWELSQNHNKVVFVSRNENLRTKSEIIGVRAISYDGTRNDDSCLYSGIIKFEISKKYQFLDDIFLRVLNNHPEKMSDIFFEMFKASPKTVIKFLSNKSNFFEDFKIILKMPKQTFIKALFY